MKYRIVFVALIFLANVTLSQKPVNVPYKFNEYNIGKNELTKDSIYAIDISFEDNISDFHLDTGTKIIVSYFKIFGAAGESTNTEIINALDLNSKKLLWNELVQGNRIQFFFHSNNVYANYNKFTGLIDLKTLNFKWKVKGNYNFDSELLKKNIYPVINYKNSEGSYDIACIDSSGNEIWKNEISDGWGFRDFGFVNDSNYIFVNSNIFSYNLFNGKSWRFSHYFNSTVNRTYNEFHNYSNGLLGFFITEVFINLLPNENKFKRKAINRLYTNFLIKDSFFFVSNHEFLFKLDYQGRVIKFNEHKNNSGIIDLIDYNDKIYYVQTGRKEKMLENNLQQFSFGNPKIALYDYNCKLLNEKGLNQSVNSNLKNSKGYILDYSFNQSKFTLLTSNSIIILDTGLNILKSKVEENKISKNWKEFYRQPIYIENNGEYQLDTTNSEYNILNEDNSISQYNTELKNIQTINHNRYYYVLYEDANIKVLKNDYLKNQIILNRNLKQIITMSNLVKVLFHQDKYYIALQNGYYIINKDQLVK